MASPVSPTISPPQPHRAVPSLYTIRSLLLAGDTGLRSVWPAPATRLRSRRPPATQTEFPSLALSLPQVRSAPPLPAIFPRQSRPLGRTTFPHQTKCASKIKPSSPVFLIPE